MYTKSVRVGYKMSASKENKKMQQITIKLKVDDLNRLREYADTKGGNPVTHYIREAVSEFLENHYK
jgi:predicted DNA binding CopG/RHH family protein